MSYITKKTTTDGIKPIGSNLFGTCSSASSTATKTVVMPDFNVLVEGVTIHIQFTNANTAENPTLKVGSTSAVAIQRNGNLEGVWESGSVISFTYNGTCWVQNDADVSGDSGKTYTFSIDGHTLTIEDSDGDTQTLTLPDDDTKYGLSISGKTISLVPNGSGTQVTIPDDDTTYTMSISGHTLTLTPSSGTAQSITLPDDNVTYSLSKSGSTITLTGSDGSTTSVTDSNTTYSGMTKAQGEAGTSTTNMVISPKVLHDVVEALDDDITYSIGISGHTITLTPSEGTPQSVTVPDNNTTYTISKSGNTVTLTGSDGSTQTFTDSDTTYSAGTGLQLSGTTFSAKLGYTTSGNNRKVQADSNGNLYVTQKDDNTTYTAGTGLELNGTEFDHSNSVTAVTSASFVKVKYDAQGHITGSSAVAKSDITALGIPGSDTNNRRAFYGTCATAAATAAKVVTLSNTTGWELVAGTIVGVKFTYTNTAQNPTLNVNSTGAKSIWYGQAVLTTGNLNKAGYANRVEYYMYDGTNWVWINWGVDDNSTYYLQTYATRQTDANVAWHSNNYIKYLLASSTMTSNKPKFTGMGVAAVEKDAEILHLSWDNNGGWDSQLAIPNVGNMLAIRGGQGKDGDVQKWTDWVSMARADHAIDQITRSGTTFTATRADGTTFTFTQQDSNNRRGFYGTCPTAAATAAKVITLSNTEGWELVAGAIITVKFTNTNTANNPTFNVNGSGAKSVWYNTAAVTTSNLNRAGYATRPQMYVYDGTYWIWMGMSAEGNTTYSVMSASELSTGTATTARTMSAANTKAGLLNLFYPVGSYYETSDTSFDPNVSWGGTWVKDSAGRVTVAQDTADASFDVIGETGGVKDAIVPYHYHSVNKVTIGSSGNHTHKVKSSKTAASGSVKYMPDSNSSTTFSAIDTSGAHGHDVPAHNTNYAGTNGNATNANLQPYIVVVRWHRTA